PQSWPPTPPQAHALGGHVASCGVCAAQPVPDLSPDEVLGHLPVAAIPADLRLDVLNAAASPARAEARRSAAALSEPLDPDGWPTPYTPRRPKRGRRARPNAAEAPVGAAPGDAGQTPNRNAEAPAPGPAGRPGPDVIGSGAPDTTLSFEAVPGDAPAGRSPSSGGGGGGGGGRHSRDASSGKGEDGEDLKPRRSGRIPEDGDRWVAGELRSARGRKRAVLATAGSVAAVAVLGAAVAAFAGGGGGGAGPVAKGGNPATPSPSESVVEPPMKGAGTPSGTPTLHAKTGSSSPSRSPSATPTTTSSSPTPHTHTTTQPPRRTTPPPATHPPRPGTLSVAGCSIGLGDSCEITVTATGGSVTWRVVGVSRGLSASGSGTLSAGRSATVQVRRESMCWGSRTGQVAFSPSGTAAVSFC
ncbi:hypothetical protein EBO15_42665, partial [Actinomadura harenae]